MRYHVRMNVAVRHPAMSREQFLDWVQRQEGRFEFDGYRPIPMTGGSRNHSLIAVNILVALRTRLRGSSFWVLGPDAGLATGGSAVRYPDLIVTSSRGSGDDLLIPDVVVAFEVVSPTSVRTDRVVKLREYLGVASMRRYVIVEQAAAALTVLERDERGTAWQARALARGESLAMPEIAIEVPVSEFYEDVDLPDEPTSDAETS